MCHHCQFSENSKLPGFLQHNLISGHKNRSYLVQRIDHAGKHYAKSPSENQPCWQTLCKTPVKESTMLANTMRPSKESTMLAKTAQNRSPKNQPSNHCRHNSRSAQRNAMFVECPMASPLRAHRGAIESPKGILQGTTQGGMLRRASRMWPMVECNRII